MTIWIWYLYLPYLKILHEISFLKSIDNFPNLAYKQKTRRGISTHPVNGI